MERGGDFLSWAIGIFSHGDPSLGADHAPSCGREKKASSVDGTLSIRRRTFFSATEERQDKRQGKDCQFIWDTYY